MNRREAIAAAVVAAGVCGMSKTCESVSTLEANRPQAFVIRVRGRVERWQIEQLTLYFKRCLRLQGSDLADLPVIVTDSMIDVEIIDKDEADRLSIRMAEKVGDV